MAGANGTKLPAIVLQSDRRRASDRSSGASLLLVTSHLRGRGRANSDSKSDLLELRPGRCQKSTHRSEAFPSIFVHGTVNSEEEMLEEEGHLSWPSVAAQLRRGSAQDLNECLGPPKIITAIRRRNDQRSQRRQVARNRLRRVFCLALLVVQWLKYVYHRAGESILSLMSISQLDDEPGLFEGHELLFDPHTFRAQREGRLPADARLILATPSEKRTDEQIRYLRIALRGLKEFRVYPVNIQQKMCRVGWYEGYGPKRAIIRQGHVPFAFYMILSGSVVVTVKDEKSNTSSTVCFLHPGMSFGELALITRSRRQATIVSKTGVELLCISAEDFEEMFMAGGLKIWEDPVTLRLMREVNCLVKWPVHVMKDHPADCMFQYFPRGQVLAQNSLESEWIYIVRSGSLSVFRKLVGRRCLQDPLVPIAPRPTHIPGAHRPRNPECDRLAREGGDRTRRRADPVASDKFGSRAELELALEKRVPGFVNREDRLGLVDYAAIFERHAHKMKPLNAADAKERNRRLWRRGAHLATNGRRTITGTFQRAPSPLDDAEEEIFMRLQILERGQYFGITNLVFPDQPSLILISNGAECLMISRKIYLKFANEECIRRLRKTEVPFPPAAELSEKFQAFRKWQDTKQQLLAASLCAVKSRRENSKE